MIRFLRCLGENSILLIKPIFLRFRIQLRFRGDVRFRRKMRNSAKSLKKCDISEASAKSQNMCEIAEEVRNEKNYVGLLRNEIYQIRKLKDKIIKLFSSQNKHFYIEL